MSLINEILGKQRRVKCDETRPSCIRCLKLKATCGGYGKRNSKTQPAAHRPLLPAIGVPSIRSTPGCSPFRSGCEKAHFETWHLTSQDFSGDDLFDIFSVTVTQLAFGDDVLREAVLALGALKFALSQHVTLSPGEQSKSNPHYQTALSRYGRSLRAVAAMAVTESTISTILRCCILFICFDLLDGRHQSVHIHIEHGLRILQEFLRSKANGVDLDLCAASPAPYIIDDSMVHLFQRCSSVSYVHLAPKRSLQQCEVRPRGGAERSIFLKSIFPRSFDSLREAVRWLDLAQNAVSVSLSASASRRRPGGESDGSTPDNKWQTERRCFLEILDDWAAAFLPVLQREEYPRCSTPEKVTLITSLMIQWHNAYIFTYTSHYHDYQSLREMDFRFKNIVDLAKALVDKPYQARRVTPLTISGIVLPLFVTANKCRDAEIRASAEETLRQLHHRVDGLWDSRAALALVQWARRTEDAYASKLADPEEVWDKVRSRYIIFNDRQSQAVVGSQCFQDSKWVYQEEVVRW